MSEEIRNVVLPAVVGILLIVVAMLGVRQFIATGAAASCETPQPSPSRVHDIPL